MRTLIWLAALALLPAHAAGGSAAYVRRSPDSAAVGNDFLELRFTQGRCTAIVNKLARRTL